MTMTTGILALIILTVILLQVAVGALLLYFHSKGHYKKLDNPVDEAEPAQNTSTKATSTTAVSTITRSTTDEESYHPAEAAWKGFREFIVQRRVPEDSQHSVCSFYLAPTDGQPLPPFIPGQFLTFKLAISDTDQTKSVVRCYSLSDAPRSDYYRISVKRAQAPVGLPEIPAGLASSFLHDQVREGDTLQVRAPGGHFHLMEAEPLPIVLIGGGIGITPMLSMLNTLLENGTDREIWLYYGVCNGADQIMKEHLQTFADNHHNFHLYICYSAPLESDIEGIDYQHKGRVTLHLLRDTLKLMRYQFYVCGPKPMMESLVPGLQEWGVDSGDIYYESFGPASLIKHEQPQPSASAEPITVTFSESGKSIVWDVGAASLLEFAETNNIDVMSGCHAGSCGTCQTKVKSGEVEYTQQPDADVEPGHCLLCISTPRCDLTLEA
ncbi:2Fe-2S iron-sulfur cluster-binding protein [Amphritea pacifica]|uniref:2Fe-2S iron-sulfur cluster-binding protein n=1 Tax=Amphritea pacifica TaxID=2811233 RepID=UPI001966A054|nr:2Fe-2S iron-sulfur cluster-binding protein [Amphritea pacifica]MBN1005642.1 2Fe-2S iron-sulfur cluster binding domain-containing protein [Amphritea pacifica]